MTDTGRLIASGRDADIFEHGPGLVLRRARSARSLEVEARVMDLAHSHGYPVPAVHDLLEDGAALVMERVDGPNMLDDAAAHPWRIARHARTLADLHNRLHEIPAPDWLPQLPDGGDRLVHLDLHPLNVIMSESGPVVIDWTNAHRGDGLTDVALTWVLLATARPPGGPARQALVSAFRALFLRAFLHCFDRDDLSARAPATAREKTADPNMSEAEVAAMLRFADREEQRTRRSGREPDRPQ
ncbi:MAG: phosphotransferase [Acidimicrobiia bacterium]|nr:phosphotransferase [Acidimicrobiia bacterium]